MNVPFISSREAKKGYISFVALPLMKHAFFASLDYINGIFITKNKYPPHIWWGIGGKIKKCLNMRKLNTVSNLVTQ